MACNTYYKVCQRTLSGGPKFPHIHSYIFPSGKMGKDILISMQRIALSGNEHPLERCIPFMQHWEKQLNTMMRQAMLGIQVSVVPKTAHILYLPSHPSYPAYKNAFPTPVRVDTMDADILAVSKKARRLSGGLFSGKWGQVISNEEVYQSGVEFANQVILKLLERCIPFMQHWEKIFCNPIIRLRILST